MLLDMLADNDNPIYVVDENGVVAYAFFQIKNGTFFNYHAPKQRVIYR